jgi:hypothetical protein
MHHEEAAQVFTELVRIDINAPSDMLLIWIDTDPYCFQFASRSSVYLEACIRNWQGK